MLFRSPGETQHRATVPSRRTTVRSPCPSEVFRASGDLGCRVEPTHRPRRRSGCVRWRNARNHSARREVARGDTTGLLPEPCASAASTRRATRFATVDRGGSWTGVTVRRAREHRTHGGSDGPRRSPESAPSDAPTMTAAPDTALRESTGDASATRRSPHRDPREAQSEASVDASPPFNRRCACAGTSGEDHEAEERCTALHDTHIATGDAPIRLCVTETSRYPGVESPRGR